MNSPSPWWPPILRLRVSMFNPHVQVGINANRFSPQSSTQIRGYKKVSKAQ
jgi:hypothetical protein